MTTEHRADTAKHNVRGPEAQFSRRLSPISLNIDRSAGSGDQMVTMVRTAELWHRYNPAASFGPIRNLTAGRRSLRQSKMRSILVIETDVLIHQALQVSLIDNDHMVQQVAASVQLCEGLSSLVAIAGRRIDVSWNCCTLRAYHSIAARSDSMPMAEAPVLNSIHLSSEAQCRAYTPGFS